MITAIKWLDKNFEKYILVFFLVAITGVLSLQVVMRFIFNNPTFWSDRVAQLSLVISMWFSISYCIRRGSSLKIDLAIKDLPEKIRKTVVVIVKVVMLVLFSFLAAASWETLGQYVERGTTDPALGIPLSQLYMVVFFSLCLTVVRCIQVLFFEFFPEKNPEIIVTLLSKAADAKKDAEEAKSSDGGDEEPAAENK